MQVSYCDKCIASKKWTQCHQSVRYTSREQGMKIRKDLCDRHIAYWQTQRKASLATMDSFLKWLAQPEPLEVKALA